MGINVLFLKSQTFVTEELIKAFRKNQLFNVTVIEIPTLYPSPTQAEQIFEKTKHLLPAIIFSINEAGYDTAGVLHEKFVKSGSYQINWFHDFPFYNHIYSVKPPIHSPRKVDFTSEFSFLPELRSKGYTAHFLPLAVDPDYFQKEESCTFERDIAFVGNSTIALMDGIINPTMAHDIEKNGFFFLEAKNFFYRNPTADLTQWILDRKEQWQPNSTFSDEIFTFAVSWMIGYMYRRDCLKEISDQFGERLTIFGDQYWKTVVQSPVSTEANYYTTLSHVYQSTKINVNINRIQIRTSFTQRPFDCKACGAFLLTDKRELTSHYFKTTGADQELVEFDSIADAINKINYYLSHEDERLRIAENGRERIIREHSYDIRVLEMIEIFRKEWGI